MSKQRLVTLRDTEFHTVSSRLVGDSFSICVALPNDYVETDKPATFSRGLRAVFNQG